MRQKFLLMLVFMISACASSDKSQAQQGTANSTEAKIEETSPKNTRKTDFLLGNWKVIAYESEEITRRLQENEGKEGDLGFEMEATVYTTSFFEFVIDGSYILKNLSDFGDENKIVDRGKWSLSKNFKLLTFSDRGEGMEDIAMDVKVLGPQKIVLSWKSPAYHHGEIRMTLESMGE